VSYELCDVDSIFVYQSWYDSGGLYEIATPNPGGCDSIISLEITSLPTYAYYDTIIACQGDTIELWGALLVGDQDISETFSATNGCDSVAAVHVAFVEVLTSSSDILLCPGDSIMIDGQWVMDEGVVETTYASIIGCDSIHTTYISLVVDAPTQMTAIDCEALEIIVSIAASTV